MKRNFIIIISLILLAACSHDYPVNQMIGDSWAFRQVEEDSLYPATVPGLVHLDLMDNGIIDDPFYGDNERTVKWVGEKSWEYTTSFFPDPSVFEKDHIELVFEGLDTYAEVWLNDELIIRADNMFRTWKSDVKGFLVSGKNTLKVVFSPPEKINQEKAASLPYRLPDDRAFTRKSPYHFGWDWGPELVTCGIWKDVSLKGWNRLRIDDVHVSYTSIDQNPLPVDLHITIQSDQPQSGRISVVDPHNGDRLASEKIDLKEGLHSYTISTTIEDPELWWPAGLGDQKMYDWRVRLSRKGFQDERQLRFGVRQIELVREADDEGETFYFAVNGLPVFMKGANYVPQDNFLTRVDSSLYLRLIESVTEANMNMLRVWGGGFYENDIFYDLCDKYGILVWQDFMFACNMYPGDQDFIENVRLEVADNVSRLSNHPCIALWCGNNEIDEGWHNWGWQDQLGYTEQDSAKIWNDYLKLFHDVLPATVETYDPGTIYWPSSPMTGWGREEAYIMGDVHYWGVWWGEEPFSKYLEKAGRFVSEYGFQGMPPMETIQSFGGIIQHPASSIQYPDSSILEAHQKHPRGTALIRKYMERDFLVPDDFEDYVYVSQVLQAEGMGQAFYTHRISQPYCMGTLYWQLNDCWPVTSWSGLDYYGRWKALHYHVKRAYAPLMVRTFEDENGLHVFAVNDHPEGVALKLQLLLATFLGDTLMHEMKSISLSPQSNQRLYYYDSIPVDKTDKVFIAKLIQNDSVISTSYHYFVPSKELDLDDPAITYSISGNEGRYVVRVKTKKLARQVFLEARGAEGHFSDNFFDMAAGEIRWISFNGEIAEGELNDRLKIKTLYETY